MELSVLKQVTEEFIPFNKMLGVMATRIEKGKVRLEIPFRPELVGDPMKPALHGGVISALADTAGGMAVWGAVENELARISTIDLRVDYLRPAKLEQLVADAVTIRVGGRVGVADVRLFHASHEDETIATAKGVYAIKIPKGQPR